MFDRAPLRAMVLTLGLTLGCGSGDACLPFLDGAIATDAATAVTDASTPSCPMAGEQGCATVVIPGGPFTMGNDNASYNGSIDAGIMTVSGFSIDADEVTVARFRRFWTAGHPAPNGYTIRYPHYLTTLGGSVTEPDTSTSDPAATWSASAASLEHHPINDVDWYTAQSFCVWDGGRLPTETEWEYAARGWAAGAGLMAGRPFPWGAMPDGGIGCALYAQWNRCTGDDGNPTKQVGSFQMGASGGINDLAGNVWEWTADWYENYGDPMCWCHANQTDPFCLNSSSGVRVVRGGSWNDTDTVTLRSASRSYGAPSGRDPAVGFRCVRSL